MIERIKEQVKKECSDPSFKHHPWYWDYHILPVLDIALKLAERYNADKKVIELAAYLHDIGKIRGLESHAESGAKIAEEKLREFGCPEDKIQKVKHCVLSHRGSQLIEPETVEAKIVADADALAAFDHIHGPFMAAFVYEKRSQSSARDSVRQKYVNSWNKLNFQESKDIIKPKFEAIKLLLG